MNVLAAAIAAALAGGILLGMAPSVSHHYGSCRFVAKLSGATFSLIIFGFVAAWRGFVWPSAVLSLIGADFGHHKPWAVK